MLWNGFHGQSIRKLSNLTFTLMALICIINTTSFNIDCRHCERCEQRKYHRMSNIAAPIEMRPLHFIFVHLSVLPPSLLSLSSNPSVALHHFRLPPNEWRKEISISKQILPWINSPIHLRITIFFATEKRRKRKKALKQVQLYVLSLSLCIFCRSTQFQHKSIQTCTMYVKRIDEKYKWNYAEDIVDTRGTIVPSLSVPTCQMHMRAKVHMLCTAIILLSANIQQLN